MRGDLADRMLPLGGGTPVRGDCVLYWMEQSRRASWNHALEAALREGARLRVPVYVFTALPEAVLEAGIRHRTFLLEGLRETAVSLQGRGIGLIARIGNPAVEIVALARELHAAAVFVDAGHLRHQRRWREEAALLLEVPLIEVETDLVVPVWSASGIAETAAWTLRKKLAPHLEHYLRPLVETDPFLDASVHGIRTEDLSDVHGLLARLEPDPGTDPHTMPQGGEQAGLERWGRFLSGGLDRYAELSREPGVDGTSGMSPYLRFGQVSSLRMALDARAGGSAGAESFLEQLIVRRELAFNLVRYREDYDRYGSVPAWARASLAAHAGDPREALYTLAELEAGATGDEYWNAAQRELVETGGMHGYMRMYWGKRVIDWTEHPAVAFDRLVTLNNRYSLDGGDPCSYTGIAWCFGMHDRPFGEHPVTGNLRRLGSALPKMRLVKSSRYNRYLRRRLDAS